MSSLNSPTGPVIVALDYADADQALAMAKMIPSDSCRVKVGKELFTRAGPRVIDSLVGLGFEVFLDLKFHDIPNTVAKAVTAAADQGVWMLNVHASGGPAMLEAARQAIPVSTDAPQLIAVTLLTSLSAQEVAAIGYSGTPAQQVVRLAGLAHQAGLDGVVCSAQEAPLLRAEFSPEFSLVTPGIRPLGASAGDQTRILTPAQALAAGSDYLVIGRPITASPDPAAALASILADIA